MYRTLRVFYGVGYEVRRCKISHRNRQWSQPPESDDAQLFVGSLAPLESIAFAVDLSVDSGSKGFRMGFGRFGQNDGAEGQNVRVMRINAYLKLRGNTENFYKEEFPNYQAINVFS